MTVPYWIQDAVFYQIFPDRFAKSDQSSNSSNFQPWGSPPNRWGFMGGDLRGIIQKFDYLLDLGVNALYFNPIFLSPANHRYSTVDYFKIDPRLGNMKDFRALLDLAHSNSMRVILDGVFNHCSRGFFAFVDLLENQEHSGYRDWFHVHKFPLDAYGPGKADHFEAWWGLKSLPKLNTRTKAVRQYIFDIARYWIEQGADGWRLDVPNEIDDDAFWAEFRQVVKNANPDAYLVGEIWTADKRWVGPGHFDGLMNYPVRDALVEFINTDFLSAGEFGKKIENLLSLYPKENGYAMYLPLGSHDTERIRTKLEGDVRKVKLAFAFLFAYPGAPAIYYGDEIGLTGDKDPECRGAFNWEHSSWNSELRNWVMTLIALRRKHPTLRRGDFQRVMAEDRKKLFAFSRTLGKETILVAVNAGPVQRNWRLPVGALGWEEGRILRNLLGRGEFVVSGEQISLQIAPWECIWIG